VSEAWFGKSIAIRSDFPKKIDGEQSFAPFGADRLWLERLINRRSIGVKQVSGLGSGRKDQRKCGFTVAAEHFDRAVVSLHNGLGNG